MGHITASVRVVGLNQISEVSIDGGELGRAKPAAPEAAESEPDSTSGS